MAKSLTVAFLLWGTLGLFGAHHFYLRRDRHGVVHLVTLGGCLLGWLWDAFRMRKYVQWANFDAEFKEQYIERMKRDEKPSDTIAETLALTVLAQCLWSLVRAATPEAMIPDSVAPLVVPLAMAFVLAFAVYYIGNIGESQGSLWSAAQGALISVPYYIYNRNSATIWCLMLSRHTFGKARKFRPSPEQHGGKLRRLGHNTLAVGVVVLLALSYFYFNCTTKADDGEPEVRCIDSVRHFFASSGWDNFSETVVTLYNYVRYHGFGSLWKEIFNAFDSTGEDNAANLLGVSKSASEEEIKAVYKKLARQYHPDRVKDPKERAAAQQKFMEIAAAYELLSTTKANRAKTNKQAPKEATKTEL